MDSQKIEILISTKVWDPNPWLAGLARFDSVDKVHLWPTDADLSNVAALFVWKPLDADVVEHLPNLKWVSSLGAGVDHLVNDKQISAQIPMTRIVDPYLTRDMTNYVIMGVMMHQRRMLQHLAHQKSKSWKRLPYHSLKVGVLGLGALGAHCAIHLAQLGFETSGFSRTRKNIANVKCYADDEMTEFLAELDVLVNLLPVTPKTVSILDQSLFKQMKKGSYLINVARGNHLVEQDLIDALDTNQLSGALLDVFREEPLPSDNPLWTHPKITITPHVASVTTPESAMNLLKVNIEKLLKREPLLHRVNREAGY